jgi:hypothetical protein
MYPISHLPIDFLDIAIFDARYLLPDPEFFRVREYDAAFPKSKLTLMKGDGL